MAKNKFIEALTFNHKVMHPLRKSSATFNFSTRLYNN